MKGGGKGEDKTALDRHKLDSDYDPQKIVFTSYKTKSNVPTPFSKLFFR